MRKVIYALVAFQLGRMTYQAGAAVHRWDDETKIDCFFIPVTCALVAAVVGLLVTVIVVGGKSKEKETGDG